VKVKGELEEKDLEKLRKGMKLEGAITAPARVKPLKKTENNSWVEITIYEGRKRQIRRMMERLDHPVLKLKRIAIAGIKLGYLQPGELRHLSPEEVNAIRRGAGKGREAGKQTPRTKKAKAIR
jgi:23S rRNA pseudouridine2605 synthase